MRFNIKHGKEIDSPKVDSFLQEIKEVCEKHGFCIEHEDPQGGFIIEKYNNEKDFEWLWCASIGKTIDDA